MEVYEFNKSFEQRFDELKIVFDSFVHDEYDKISSMEIHSLWVDFTEVTIEPTGWTALWRIPRVTCEKLKIKYPTVVYGMVENVFYKELNCSYRILTVEDEDVKLAELQEVSLEELYPTIDQENSEVNTYTTANAIDQLRFFYNHLWMPWDCENDDDIICFQKELKLRLNFYYDIQLKRIEQCLIDRINNLIMDARYVQKRREYLELDLSDVEDNDDTNGLHAKDLLKLHLRMSMIKNELELIQNPEMRVAYKEINFNRRDSIKPLLHSSDIYLVLQEGNVTDIIKYLKRASKIVDNIKIVTTCATLQEALNKSNSPDIIYIPPGDHKISYHESFKNNGTIKTIIDQDISKAERAVISNSDNDRVLMSFDGDFTLENITLDCRNVDTGMLINNGCVVLKNCKLFDDGKSSVKQGIVVVGRAKVKLINCVISNFAIGITIQPDADVLLMDNTTISNCHVGIEMDHGCELKLFDSKIENSKSCGICCEPIVMDISNQRTQVFDKFDESNLKSVTANQNFKFENNQNRNIVVRKKEMLSFVQNKGKLHDIEDSDPSVILIDDSITDD